MPTLLNWRSGTLALGDAALGDAGARGRCARGRCARGRFARGRWRSGMLRSGTLTLELEQNQGWEYFFFPPFLLYSGGHKTRAHPTRLANAKMTTYFKFFDLALDLARVSVAYVPAAGCASVL